MSIREVLGEIDGLVLAFIGLTAVLALSAMAEMTLPWRVALGIPVVVAMLAAVYLRRKKARRS